MQKSKALKLVIVGDGSVGKTCILLTYSRGEFPKEYIPTIFDTYEIKLSVDGRDVSLGLWDTAGQEEYQKVRPLSYANTDICLIVFAIDDKASFSNAQTKWVPEIKENMPGTTVYLVANKIDLRTSQSNLITSEQGKKMADALGIGYFECSPKENIGLKELFETSVKTCLNKAPSKQALRSEDNTDKDKSGCQLI